MGVEYVRGTIIGQQTPRFRCEFWTRLMMPGNPEHKITGSHYFESLVEAGDWLKENYASLKAKDCFCEWWGVVEMRSWDMNDYY